MKEATIIKVYQIVEKKTGEIDAVFMTNKGLIIKRYDNQEAYVKEKETGKVTYKH